MEELGETINEESVDGWMLSVACTEGAERGQVAIGEGSAIDALDDVSLSLVGFVEEQLTHVLR